MEVDAPHLPIIMGMGASWETAVCLFMVTLGLLGMTLFLLVAFNQQRPAPSLVPGLKQRSDDEAEDGEQAGGQK